MSKTYKYEQILFALRREYLEIEKQLANLKRYVNVEEDVEDFYFHLRPGKEYGRMLLYLAKKQSLLDKLSRKLGTYVYGLTNFDVTESIELSYRFKSKTLCTVNNVDEVNEQITQIIESIFAKNITANDEVGIPCVDNQLDSILITTDGSRLIRGIDSKLPKFDYNPRKDEIYVCREEEIIMTSDIYEVLNLRIDSSYLNDYHRAILDKYPDKEVIISESFHGNEAVLKIVEEPKRLFLRPHG